MTDLTDLMAENGTAQELQVKKTDYSLFLPIRPKPQTAQASLVKIASCCKSNAIARSLFDRLPVHSMLAAARTSVNSPSLLQAVLLRLKIEIESDPDVYESLARKGHVLFNKIFF